MKFSIKCFFRKCDQTHKKTAVLTKFTDKIHNRELNFLYSDIMGSKIYYQWNL